jgi:hypothetical protein
MQLANEIVYYTRVQVIKVKSSIAAANTKKERERKKGKK